MKKNQNEIAVKLTNVSKRYTIHHEKPTLAEKFINGREESFLALKNINLRIKKGEKVGIIGANGSGKTTLLKIITGITSPTSGKVETYGKIVSLIDLEAGFHPDLTGIQNIFLNGMLLGMDKKEISKKLADIINFADIGGFIDVPLFTYSDGMKFRLGFSVAINSDPDILILDEGFGAVDEQFKTKAMNNLQKNFKGEGTIIISTHYMDFVRKNCQKAICLDKGVVKIKGSAIKVINKYSK